LFSHDRIKHLFDSNYLTATTSFFDSATTSNCSRASIAADINVRSNSLHAAFIEAVEEESDGISMCFWDDGQEYSMNEMFSLEEVDALFDTSHLPDIESVLANDDGQLWFSTIEILNDMAVDTFKN
jgi:hypothetical protein